MTAGLGEGDEGEKRERVAWRAGPCVLGGGCDHNWQWRDSSEGKGTAGLGTRVAMVMHVTSMRPHREKLGMGSAPHPVAQYLC